MSIEADLYNTIAKFKSLEVDSQPDYYRNYMYSIATESAILDGADVSLDDTRSLLDTGIVPSGKRLRDVDMLMDLVTAYSEAEAFAVKASPISVGKLNRLCYIMMRRTGKNFFGNVDLCCLKPDLLSEFCEKFNIRSQDYYRKKLMAQYEISFDAMQEVSQLMPWDEGNLLMGRIVMFYFQKMFGILPTMVSHDDRKVLDEALVSSDIAVYRMMMFELHIRNVNKEISNYIESISNKE